MWSDPPACCCQIDCCYRHLYQAGSLRSKLWPVSVSCTVGLFKCLRTLMLICAHSGRVLGLERKTDLASSARSSREALKDNNNRLLGIVNKFCIPFGTEIKISICGELDNDCTVGTLNRVANFRVKNLNSDIKRNRRGVKLLVILIMRLVLILLHRFFQ